MIKYVIHLDFYMMAGTLCFNLTQGLLDLRIVKEPQKNFTKTIKMDGNK